ncbi:winged helix-turn-helix domain-containing protein [Martelella soudanensis]|uniref:winged helix-turn-helix domain-containing protein n=1 Tax=unclassified Martelella TaxID=2629616 RepID=UPI0015E02DDB|nr:MULTISPECIES: winged helix-turn-helix domain-containing protein [unclassified Martelella]
MLKQKALDLLKPRILVVENGMVERDSLFRHLLDSGYAACVAMDGKTPLQAGRDERPDIVLFHWVAPNDYGFNLCRSFKQDSATRQIPLIILSGNSDEEDKVKGLELGADDYLAKPYSPSELTARLHVQLRRFESGKVKPCLTFERIALDEDALRVYVEGRPVHLGPTEYRLLAAFMARPGRPFTREQLLERVGRREGDVDIRSVDVHIGRLRKALNQKKVNYPLRTIRGIGYALG